MYVLLIVLLLDGGVVGLLGICWSRVVHSQFFNNFNKKYILQQR